MVTVSIEHREGFLLCRVSGKNSEENVIRYLNELHDAMVRYQCGKVLIIEDLSGPGLNLLKMYHIISTARKTILARPHAIAYIDRNPEHDHRSLRFAETVALNRFIHMRLFTDQEEAVHWLEQMTV